MAHFAEIDQNGTVLQVIVIDNEKLLDDEGVEQEALGAAFCQKLYGGGEWLQTSYNGNFRKNFAGPGHRYDWELDAFIPPQPYPSWMLDEESCQWQPPSPRPDDGQRYVWDESITDWVQKDIGTE